MLSGRRRRRTRGRQGLDRGWLLVATLAVTETTSYGVLGYAFGVFLLPMHQELGWSRTALTGAYSLAIIVSGVAAIPVGRWLDRHGARLLMTTGSAAATLLVLAWAQVTDLGVFYAIWAGIGVAMAAVLYDPAFAIIVTWFRDQAERARALLALTVIAGFASVIYVPLAGWLVETQGWRDALVVLAVLLVPLTVLPGVVAYGSINGVLALPLTVARAAAPVAAAALRTATGHYGLVMAAVAASSVVAGVAMARAQWLHGRRGST